MSIKELEGKLILNVYKTTYEGNDAIKFECLGHYNYIMTHTQDCCENVSIESITVNDLSDLIGQVIELAEEKRQTGNNEDGSETWTFYTIRSVNASVDIRWYGSSNGYYSESVEFFKL